MSLSKISSYATGDVNITALMSSATTQRKGLHQATLTEMDTTTIPQVSEGSVIEVNNTLYEAGADTSISGSASAGTNYIYLVPGADIVTPTWTTTAPTWSDAKQGWYGTGGSAGYRYIHYKIVFDTPDYYKYRNFAGDIEKSFVFAEIATTQAINQTPQIMIFDVEEYDLKDEYNTSTGVFTARDSGCFLVTFAGSCNPSVVTYAAQVYVNGATVPHWHLAVGGTYLTFSSTVFLEKNDTLDFRVYYVGTATGNFGGHFGIVQQF